MTAITGPLSRARALVLLEGVTEPRPSNTPELARSCSGWATLVHPDGPELFVLFAALALLTVVPAAVLIGTHSLALGLAWAPAALALAVMMWLLARRRAAEAVARELAWIAAQPQTIGPEYLALLRSRPHRFTSQGSEGVVSNTVICRHLRVHLRLRSPCPEDALERLRAALGSSVIASEGDAVAITRKLACSDHARPARDYFHSVLAVARRELGDDRIVAATTSWTRETLLARSALASTAPFD